MTTSRTTLLALIVRACAVPYLLAGLAAIGYGAPVAIADELDHGEWLDGLGTIFGGALVAAGIPVVALAFVVVRHRRPRVAATCAVVLAVTTLGIGALAGDYTPWWAVAVTVAYGVVAVAHRVRLSGDGSGRVVPEGSASAAH